jgi:hypothetical protein
MHVLHAYITVKGFRFDSPTGEKTKKEREKGVSEEEIGQGSNFPPPPPPTKSNCVTELVIIPVSYPV